MIKVSAVLGASLVTVLFVSLLGLNQNEIAGSQLMDPIIPSDKLEKCLNGETEECMAIFCSTDHEVLAVEDINVLEKDEDIDLGFDVKSYLPTNFNPYSTEGDFNSSTQEDNYLPSGLDGTAILGNFIQIEDYKPVKVGDIVVLENDDDIDLGFNVRDYLPKNFNPYASRM